MSSQRLVRKTCLQCLRHNTTDKAQCAICKGSAYFGRIGVHEILSKIHLLNSSTSYISMRDAGLAHIQAGLIKQADLDAEVGSWH